MHVLVVDDEKELRRVVVRWLEKEGHSTSEAGSVSSAEGLARSGWFDVILLDLLLDAGNGWENIARLRAVTAAPIVVMTGASVDEDSCKDARLLGAQGMLGKPFTPEELRAALAGAAPG